MTPKTRRHWSKLPPVTHGYSRVPDALDGTRMVECDACGARFASLGIGYHLQNVKACAKRAAAGGDPKLSR